MSNQVNHRRSASKNNTRQDERPQFAMSCGDHGHNGKLGRKKWVKLSRRNERRNAKQGRPATIRKFKKESFDTGLVHSTMFSGHAWESPLIARKTRSAKPAVPDTGEDE